MMKRWTTKKLRFEQLENRHLLSISAVADFEDVGATLGTEDFWQGDENQPYEFSSFQSGPCQFANIFFDYDTWSGYGYSNVTVPNPEDFFSAASGIGADGSATIGHVRAKTERVCA
jgi:hypothetical protein